MNFNFAVVIPMANEQEDFHPFVASLTEVLNMLECGKVYFVIDKVSKDNTLELCNNLLEIYAYIIPNATDETSS